MFLFLISSHAFTTLDSSWNWQADPIEQPFVLDYGSFPVGFATQLELEGAVVEALRMWNSHPTAAFQARYGGLASAASGDVIRIHYVADSGAAAVGQAPVLFDPTSGESLEASIVIYGANNNGPVSWYVSPDIAGLPVAQNDLVSTLAHEIGHVSGLDHTGIDSAIMAPARIVGTGYRELHIDDRAGLESIYGTATINFNATIHGEQEVGIRSSDAFARVTVQNIGDKLSVLPQITVVGGPAFLVNAVAPEPDVDLGPGDSIVYELPIEVDGCSSALFDVMLQITDRNGSSIQVEATADIECPLPTPPPEEPESKGCSTSAPSNWWRPILSRW